MNKILIADDSSFQRKILGDMIEELGHECHAVDSGQALLDRLELESFDCMCLDLLMPGMTGIEVLEELERRDNKIPVIVISADIQTKKRDRCLELGAAAFINKYINKDDLANELKKHLTV